MRDAGARAKHNERARQRHAARPDVRAAQKQRGRDGHSLRAYGIPWAEAEAIRQRPCGICQPKGPRMAIDHDHQTGRIRGALCLFCNVHLAWLERHESTVAAWRIA